MRNAECGMITAGTRDQGPGTGPPGPIRNPKPALERSEGSEIRHAVGRRAVSLPELIAVLAVMALVLTVAIPRLARSGVWGTEGKAAARNLAGALRLARRMAVDHGAANPLGYRLEGAASTYRIYDLASGVYTSTPQGLPEGWRFEETNYAVTFNPYGAVSSYVASGPCLVLYRGGEKWAVAFETATGYVWIEGG